MLVGLGKRRFLMQKIALGSCLHFSIEERSSRPVRRDRNTRPPMARGSIRDRVDVVESEAFVSSLGNDSGPMVVLLIENSLDDVRLTREAFRKANPAVRLHVSPNRVDAMEFLRRIGTHKNAPRPDLILLDLNLPREDGREILAEIRGDADLRTTATVILTGSDVEPDIVESYQLHANCYLNKPVQSAGFESLVESINEFWVRKAKLPSQWRRLLR